MTAIASSLPPIIAQASPAASAQATQSQSSANSFGEAVNVSLSAPAQAAVTGQNTSSSVPSSQSATAATSQDKGQAPIVSQASTIDVAQLVSAATRKVAPQVGVTGARDVIDCKGNISKVQLAIEIAEQAQKG